MEIKKRPAKSAERKIFKRQPAGHNNKIPRGIYFFLNAEHNHNYLFFSYFRAIKKDRK